MTELIIEDGNPVTAQGEAPFVIRLSRTASGSRTYTIGASLGRDEDPDGVVAALFELERLVTEGMEKPAKASKPKAERDNTIRDLRRSLILSALSKVGGKGSTPEQQVGYGWMTTPEIVTALGNGNHRSQVVDDLKTLVAAGLVEYQRGKGGNYPSLYRLAVKVEPNVRERAKARRVTQAQKGKVKA